MFPFPLSLVLLADFYLFFFSFVIIIMFISFSLSVTVDLTFPLFLLDLLLYIYSSCTFLLFYFSLYSLLFLYIVAIFSQSFSFSPNRLHLLLPSWHTSMCSVVSSSVLQKGHVCLIHCLSHPCNLIFMPSFVLLLSHFLMCCFLSHLSFFTVQHFVFSGISHFFSFSYSVYCFLLYFIFPF